MKYRNILGIFTQILFIFLIIDIPILYFGRKFHFIQEIHGTKSEINEGFIILIATVTLYFLLSYFYCPDIETTENEIIFERKLFGFFKRNIVTKMKEIKKLEIEKGYVTLLSGKNYLFAKYFLKKSNNKADS